MEHNFKDYLPLLAALMVIFSAAIFGFILPKFADFFNERSRNKLKDTLAIKKDLELSGGLVGAEFDEIIDFYASEFVSKELEIINDKKQAKLDKYIHYTFGLGILIPIICLFMYIAMLGIMHWFGI